MGPETDTSTSEEPQRWVWASSTVLSTMVHRSGPQAQPGPKSATAPNSNVAMERRGSICAVVAVNARALPRRAACGTPRRTGRPRGHEARRRTPASARSADRTRRRVQWARDKPCHKAACQCGSRRRRKNIRFRTDKPCHKAACQCGSRQQEERIVGNAKSVTPVGTRTLTCLPTIDPWRFARYIAPWMSATARRPFASLDAENTVS